MTPSGPLILSHPLWLTLIVPLWVLWRKWPPPAGWRSGLRAACSLLLILALCQPALRLPRRGGTLVVLADRSASMPGDAAQRQLEVIERLEATRSGGDRLAVVAFGDGAVIEKRPSDESLTAFNAELGSGRSDLTTAVDRALALTSAEASSRLLLLSDGRFTGPDPRAVAGRAALRGVAIDYRLEERPRSQDVAIVGIDAPEVVTPEEGFLITAWVRSPIAQEATLELWRGEALLAAGKRQLPAGSSRVTFRDRAGAPGVASYRLQIRAEGEDPIPQNNLARFLVGVRGPRPLLVVSDASSGGITEVLRAGGLEVQRILPHQLDASLEQLAAVSGVVLEGVGVDALGPSAASLDSAGGAVAQQGSASFGGDLVLGRLASWVRGGGGGLLLTGGTRSFGTGGYFRSPLDPVLPVSMELRQEHRKLALAMVVALDRSGSMAAQVAGGRSKMDLANLATAEVLNLLSPLDEFGVVAVDSTPHLVAPLAPVENVAATREMILRIDSMGGGIFIYPALHAAAEQLLRARAGTRHILLFADASDAEQPGAYRELIEQSRAAGITISVVGLGRSTDPDADLLREIAGLGGGRVFFTERVDELPRLFAQDTFIVARSAFVEEVTPWRWTAGLSRLTGSGSRLAASSPPPVGGYNLTYLRPDANLVAVTADTTRAPLIATWQVGLGRAAAFTADVAGEYAGPLADWQQYGELLTSLGRWVAGDATDPNELLVTQELVDGQLEVRLHLDPERVAEPFSGTPEVSLLRGLPGQAPSSESQTLRWVEPDVLAVGLPLSGDEVALATLTIPGRGSRTLAPVRLPYSPEYAPADPARGRLTLDTLASQTGGRQRIEVGEAWRGLPRRPRHVELTPWLIAACILLLLLEILERRTGLLSMLGGRAAARAPARTTAASAAGEPTPEEALAAPLSRPTPARPDAARPDAARPDAARPVAARPDVAQPTEASEPSEGVLDALSAARRRARQRTTRR